MTYDIERDSMGEIPVIQRTPAGSKSLQAFSFQPDFHFFPILAPRFPFAKTIA